VANPPPACPSRGGPTQEHDYVLYRSEAGGCCDCGDAASWEPEGCCPLHKPAASSASEPPGGALLPPAARESAVAALELVFERTALALEAVAEGGLHEETAEAGELLAAHACLAWLRHACSAAALRAPAGAVLLAGAPEGGAGPDALRAALLRREAAAGSAPQRALRAGLERAPPPAALQQRRSWPLLDRLLCAPLLHALPRRTLEELTTLLLLLLFDRGFKTHFTPALLRHYRPLVACAPAGGSGWAVGAALDRVTVQLFNGAEATLALALSHGLLDCLLGLLGEEVLPLGRGTLGEEGSPSAADFYLPQPPPAALPPQRWADGAWAAGCADLSRGCGDSRVFARVVGDLRMVLAHPPVALHLLHARTDLVASLLGVLAGVQGCGRVARTVGEHAAGDGPTPQDGEWANAVALEQALVGLWGLAVEAAAEAEPAALSRGGAFSTASAEAAWIQPRPAQAGQPGVRAVAIARAAAAALRRAAAWAAESCRAEGAWSLADGGVSAHLPLHRAAAAAARALFCRLPPDAGGAAALTALMRGEAWLVGEGPPPADSASAPGALGPLAVGDLGGLALLARHPARLLAWAAEVRAGLWVRNGDSAARLEAVYGGPYWTELGADCDVMLLQLCLAAAPGAAEASELASELLPAAPLPPGRAPGPLAASQRSFLRDTLDGLALLARERQLPAAQPASARLRRAVVHALALGPLTHTQAACSAGVLACGGCEESELDAVLEAVADYRQADESVAGRFSLKPEVWAEWDPLYPLYSRAELQAAAARAVPAWRPASALRPPSLRPLPPFANLMRFLRAPPALALARACLQHAAACPADPAAEEAALGALQLLALGAAGGGGGDAPADAPALAAALAEGSPSTLDLLEALASGAPCGAAAAECAAALLTDLRARGLAPPPPPAPAGERAGKAPLADAAAAAREERRRAMRERQRAVMAAMAERQRAFAEAEEREAEESEGEESEDGSGSSSTDMEVEGEAGVHYTRRYAFPYNAMQACRRRRTRRWATARSAAAPTTATSPTRAAECLPGSLWRSAATCPRWPRARRRRASTSPRRGAAARARHRPPRKPPPRPPPPSECTWRYVGTECTPPATSATRRRCAAPSLPAAASRATACCRWPRASSSAQSADGQATRCCRRCRRCGGAAAARRPPPAPPAAPDWPLRWRRRAARCHRRRHRARRRRLAAAPPPRSWRWAARTRRRLRSQSAVARWRRGRRRAARRRRLRLRRPAARSGPGPRAGCLLVPARKGRRRRRPRSGRCSASM